MIGLPFETRELIFDTIKLNKEANVDSAAVAFFTPFKGTKLRGLCLKEGFIKEEDTLSPTRQDTALSLNTISKKELNGIMKTFIMYVNSPEWLYTLIKLAEGEDEFSKRLHEELKDIFYKKIHSSN